jgi:hypothetical protein
MCVARCQATAVLLTSRGAKAQLALPIMSSSVTTSLSHTCSARNTRIVAKNPAALLHLHVLKCHVDAAAALHNSYKLAQQIVCIRIEYQVVAHNHTCLDT